MDLTQGAPRKGSPNVGGQHDEHAPSTRTLLAAVNACATAARYGSVALSALVAFVFVTIATLTHKDLLLNSPVMLPFLQIEIPLLRFFVFAPILLLVVHALVLVQHVILRGTIDAYTRSLDDADRANPLRLELSSYFFVQAYAGPRRPAVITGLLFSASWLTLVLLPVLAFLYFQVAFLPRHHAVVTWAHRIYLSADLVLLFVMGTLILFPQKKLLAAPLQKLRYRPALSLGVHATILCALFFSYCVATLPGSGMDVFMRGIHAKAPQLGLAQWYGNTTATQSLVFEKVQDLPAFWVTSWLFEGEPDIISGKATSLFARNLIVMNTDLVPDEGKEQPTDEVSLALRGRDLRHARLDGTDLHRADLTGADLRHASLVKTDLRKARLQTADMRYANLNWADLRGAHLNEADLRRSVLRETDLDGAKLNRADLREAILTWARMRDANLSRADFRKATLSWANMDRAKLVWSNLKGANLYGVSLRDANLAHWQLEATVLSGAAISPVDPELADAIRAATPPTSHELLGVWVGEARQPDFAGDDLTYAVKLSINEFGNGFVDYPGLSCMGLNAGMRYADTYIFEERIDKGRDYCRDGHVKIRVSGRDMAWTWYYADGRFGASGVLQKQR